MKCLKITWLHWYKFVWPAFTYSCDLHLRSLKCVTKSCKLCVFKKEKKWKIVIYVFVLHRSRCNLSAYHNTTYCITLFLQYSALLLLNFFGRKSDFYHANTHRLTFLGLLHIISVFRHFSFCHWSLPRVSASCIFLCYHDFFHIRLCYLFCWVSIRSFFQDN